MVWAGTVTCCSLPRVSVNLKSTYFTSFSLIMLRMSAPVVMGSPPLVVGEVSYLRPLAHGPKVAVQACLRIGLTILQDLCQRFVIVQPAAARGLVGMLANVDESLRFRC